MYLVIHTKPLTDVVRLSLSNEKSVFISCLKILAPPPQCCKSIC